MAETDPWAGMVDPRAALAAVKRAAKNSSQAGANSSQVGKSEKQEKSTVCERSSRISHYSQREPAHLPASHDSRKEEIDLSSSSISMTYPLSASPAGSPIPELDHLGTHAPAKVAKRLNSGLSHSEGSEIPLAEAGESFSNANTVPSPTSHLCGPQEWRDGVAHLDRWEPPCPGFRPGEWEVVGRVIRHFMSHYAENAAQLGWTAIDLFAVHPRVGAVRVDCCGALMLPTASVVTAISARAITFGPTVYRKKPMPEAVLAWAFGGAS